MKSPATVAYLPLPWLALWITAEAFVPVTRPRLTIEGFGTAYRAPAFGVRGALGVEFRFP